jgi:hypothetical protein
VRRSHDVSSRVLRRARAAGCPEAPRRTLAHRKYIRDIPTYLRSSARSDTARGRLWLLARQAERSGRHHDTNGKRADGDALAVGAMTGVHSRRTVSDLVTDRAEYAAACLWEVHASLTSQAGE